MRKIGVIANEAILAGLTDEQALAKVLEELPEAKTTIASVKVYRSVLRRQVKEGKRTAGKEGAPERRRGGIVRSHEMTPELDAELKATAARKRVEGYETQRVEQEKRLKATDAESAYRERLLTAYVARVLSVGCFTRVKSGKRKGELTRPKNAGVERLAFMNANPVNELFRDSLSGRRH